MAIKETLLRQFLIIKKVQRFPASFEEISNMLEIESEIHGKPLTLSIRQFQRYLDDIRTLYNINIRCNRSNQRYYLDTNDDEGLNQRILEAFNIFQALKLEERINNSIILEDRQDKGTEHLQKLIEAIENTKLIRVTYKKKYDVDELKTYELHPYAIKEDKRRWYLLAKDLNGNKEKTFGLDRIVDVQLTNQKFETEYLIIADKLKSCIGIGCSNRTDEEKKVVVLSFTKSQSNYVKGYKLHPSQKVLIDSDEELRIKLNIFYTYDLEKEILSFGDGVKVIQPKELANQIKKRLLKAIEKY